MTAHVVYDAFDPGLPATLCRPIVHDLLRGSLGFDGVVISDDLEMKAVADRYPIEQSSVMAVRAGCDLLLVCSDEGLQGRAHEALVHAAERDATLRHQIEASVARTLRLRGSAPVRPVEWSAAVEAELARQSEALERDLRELSPENLGQAVRH
jgi:beta-N-acetylhexosaminidase